MSHLKISILEMLLTGKQIWKKNLTVNSQYVESSFWGPFKKNPVTSCYAQSRGLFQTCCIIPLHSTSEGASPALLTVSCLGLSPEKSKILRQVTRALQYGVLYFIHLPGSPPAVGSSCNPCCNPCWALASRALHKRPAYLPYHISWEITG